MQTRKVPIPVPKTAPDQPESLPAWRVDPAGDVHQILSARPLTKTLYRPSSPEEAREMLQHTVRRRGFLAGLGMLSLGGLAIPLDYFNPRHVTGFGGVITVPAGLVPKPGQDPVHYLQGKVWLVNLKPGDGVPEAFRTVAPPSAKGGLLALYHRCVHLGCTVPWNPNFEFGGVTGWFRCPCHGSTYTKGGIRVFGPATRSLDTFEITAVTSAGVSIDTSKITLGGLNDPQQAQGRAVPAGPFV